MTDKDNTPNTHAEKSKPENIKPENHQKRPKEIGGPSGLEPTRYNDWERNGRCIDF